MAVGEATKAAVEKVATAVADSGGNARYQRAIKRSFRVGDHADLMGAIDDLVIAHYAGDDEMLEDAVAEVVTLTSDPSADPADNAAYDQKRGTVSRRWSALSEALEELGQAARRDGITEWHPVDDVDLPS
jgi:hypothetical protein